MRHPSFNAREAAPQLAAQPGVVRTLAANLQALLMSLGQRGLEPRAGEMCHRFHRHESHPQ